jgi:hypothetical protein
MTKNDWENHLLEKQVITDNNFGVWVKLVGSFLGLATLFENQALFKSLLKGKEYGLKQYKKYFYWIIWN